MWASPATAGLLPVLSVPTCGTKLYALYTPTSNPQLTQLGYKARQHGVHKFIWQTNISITKLLPYERISVTKIFELLSFSLNWQHLVNIVTIVFNASLSKGTSWSKHWKEKIYYHATMNAQPLVELFFQDMTLPMLTEANQSQPHCDEPHNQKICSFLE